MYSTVLFIVLDCVFVCLLYIEFCFFIVDMKRVSAKCRNAEMYYQNILTVIDRDEGIIDSNNVNVWLVGRCTHNEADVCMYVCMVIEMDSY